MLTKKVNSGLFYFALFLIVYMPLHVFLAQLFGHFFGHLEVWKAAKDVITVVAVPLLLYAAYRQKLFGSKFFRTVVYIGAAYTLLYGFFVLFKRNNDTMTTITGSVYNTRLLAYLLLGMVVGVAYPARKSQLVKAGIVVSTLVAVFGVAQYFLPKDLLTHVGYRKILAGSPLLRSARRFTILCRFDVQVMRDHEFYQAREVNFALPAQDFFGFRRVTKQHVYFGGTHKGWILANVWLPVVYANFFES